MSLFNQTKPVNSLVWFNGYRPAVPVYCAVILAMKTEVSKPQMKQLRTSRERNPVRAHHFQCERFSAFADINRDRHRWPASRNNHQKHLEQTEWLCLVKVATASQTPSKWTGREYVTDSSFSSWADCGLILFLSIIVTSLELRSYSVALGSAIMALWWNNQSPNHWKKLCSVWCCAKGIQPLDAHFCNFSWVQELMCLA